MLIVIDVAPVKVTLPEKVGVPAIVPVMLGDESVLLVRVSVEEMVGTATPPTARPVASIDKRSVGAVFTAPVSKEILPGPELVARILIAAVARDELSIADVL